MINSQINQSRLIRRPVQILVICIVCITFVSCAGLKHGIHEQDQEVLQGLMHFKLLFNNRILSGDIAIAISNRGWCQFEIIDPAGLTLYVGQIESKQMDILDLREKCLIKVHGLETIVSKYIGIQWDAGMIWNIFGRDPWPTEREITNIRIPRKNRMIVLDYRPTQDDYEGGVYIWSNWQDNEVRLDWKYRKRSCPGSVRKLQISNRFPVCKEY